MGLGERPSDGEQRHMAQYEVIRARIANTET